MAASSPPLSSGVAVKRGARTVAVGAGTVSGGKVVSVAFDDELFTRIRAIAVANGCSFGFQVRTLLQKALGDLPWTGM